MAEQCLRWDNSLSIHCSKNSHVCVVVLHGVRHFSNLKGLTLFSLFPLQHLSRCAHLMSAQASTGSVASESRPVSPSPGGEREEKGGRGLAGSKYVKLNVGGSLHYTTVQTLSKEDSLLRSMCNGGVEVTIDSEGKIVRDGVNE